MAKTFGDQLRFPDKETMVAVLSELKEKFPYSEPSRVAEIPTSFMGDFPQEGELKCSFRLDLELKEEYLSYIRQQEFGGYSLYIRFLLRNQDESM